MALAVNSALACTISVLALLWPPEPHLSVALIASRLLNSRHKAGFSFPVGYSPWAIGENAQAGLGRYEVSCALHAQERPRELQRDRGAFWLFKASGEGLGRQS
ncbi:hypothetical protein [Bradyrhizobium sp. USDA 372]